MEVVFLGVNDVGMRIYDWLCDRSDVDVACLLTTANQLDRVAAIQPDLLVSVGFDHRVPAEVLQIPDDGALNLHPALLPHNRGKSPNVWSIVEETPAGVTLHYMTPTFDAGPIVAQRRVPKSFDDTGKSLHRRLEEAQFDLFTDVWSDVRSGSVETEPQDSDAGNYHSVDDFQELCELDPDAEYTVKILLDVLRALTFPPFDNAHVEIDGETYYVDIDIRPADADQSEPGGLLSSY